MIAPPENAAFCFGLPKAKWIPKVYTILNDFVKYIHAVIVIKSYQYCNIFTGKIFDTSMAQMYTEFDLCLAQFVDARVFSL